MIRTTLGDGVVPGVRLRGGTPSPSEEHTFELVEPATGQPMAQIRGGGRQDAADAVDAATDALADWRTTAVGERAAALRAIAADLRSSLDGDLPAILTRESGKRLPESRGELQFSARFFDWFADLIMTKAEETWHVGPAVRHEVGWTPLGVVAVLTPWNFPASIPARKIAPALAAGCTILFKPSQMTPLSSLAIAKIVEQHVPEGVINTVCGDAATITDVWLDDDRVRGLTFTGSTQVGRLLGRRAGEALKMATLELGGRAPFIILEDVEIESAVEQLMIAKFRNNGESCIAANNVWIQRSRWDEFVDAFTSRIREMTVGDPYRDDVDLGPVRIRQAVDDLTDALNALDGRETKIIRGGVDIPTAGFFLPPTLCLEPPADSSLWQEEVFAPVALVRPFDDPEEPIMDANASQYGLAGYVCAADADRALAIARRLESGLLGINAPSPNTPQIPFGGMKASGFGGYEGGRLGLDPFIEYQSAAIGSS